MNVGPLLLDLDVCRFHVDQTFVQSKLNEDVFMRLPKGCDSLSGKVVRFIKSLYGLKKTSRSWHVHLATCLKKLGFEKCLADACVFRSIEGERVAIIVLVHVADIFVVGLKSRRERFRGELNQLVPVKNLGGTSMVGVCYYSRDRKRDNLKISQKMFADELVRKVL